MGSGRLQSRSWLWLMGPCRTFKNSKEMGLGAIVGLQGPASNRKGPQGLSRRSFWLLFWIILAGFVTFVDIFLGSLAISLGFTDLESPVDI